MFNFYFIKKIKNFFFPFYRNNDLKFVFKRLKKDYSSQSNTAMFVGGCVRKYLLAEKIDDIDIATSLTINEIKERFNNTKFNIVDSGVEHGTVTLISKKLKLEITTLRKDIKTDGRHAEIQYTDSWEEDSKRRDFTINAIYLDIKGKIYDPQLGIRDLNNQVVKFIGDPQKRIEEDYLRIIRFIRFSIEYQSKTNSATLQAIKLNLDGIKKISKERILSELLKILRTKNFVDLNKNEKLKDIFSLIFPEFKYLMRLDKLNELNNKSKIDKITLLSILLIDDSNNHEYFSHKYNVSNDLKEILNLTAKNFIKIQKNKEFLVRDLKKNIYFFGKSHLKSLNLLYFLAEKKTKINDYLKILKNIKSLNIPKFAFDGNYLKEKGMSEGVLIGKTLKLIEEEWLKNDFRISDKRVLEIIEMQNR